MWNRSRLRRLISPVMMGSKSYMARVLATGPIAYWPLNEISGSAAVNLGSLGTAANGSYSGPTLAQTAAPGGGLAPSFDGTNDFVNLYSAALAAAFDGLEFSIAIWIKASGAAIWTDSTTRFFALFQAASTNNRFQFYKSTTNNRIAVIHTTGGTGVSFIKDSFNPTTWKHIVLTYSKSGDAVNLYIDSTAESPHTSYGNFVGPLNSNTTLAGASTVAGAGDPWSGYLSHIGVWAKVLTPTEIAALYTGAGTLP